MNIWEKDLTLDLCIENRDFNHCIICFSLKILCKEIIVKTLVIFQVYLKTFENIFIVG
jgi:hypothetical protein